MPKAKPAVNPPKPASSPAPTKAAAKPRTANAVIVPAVLITGAQAAKLDLDGLAAGIRHTESVYRGAYAAYGIYRHFAEKLLPAGKITPFLKQKCGLSDSTISHTAYAAKTYAWVQTKHITEDEYNGMTCRDMTAFIQVMGTNAKAKLDPKDAIAKLKQHLADGADVAAEFNAYYEFGCSRAEMEKQAKEQARQDKLNGLVRDGRAALGDSKFKDAHKAANAVLAEDKDHAEAKRLLDDIATAEQAKKQPAASNPPASTTSTPSSSGVTGPTEPEDDGREDGKPQNQQPSNITQMPPPPKAKPTATELGDMLDKLLEKVIEADADQQRAFITSSWAAANALLTAKVKTSAKKKAA